jgi:succinate dehydrogenase hydrophobic anchor subunit
MGIKKWIFIAVAGIVLLLYAYSLLGGKIWIIAIIIAYVIFMWKMTKTLHKKE